MIVHLDPSAPLWLRALADTALGLHIGGASVGLVSGAVAVVAPKGGDLHRKAGSVFFVSMLTMAGIGAVVAPILPDIGSTIAGVFTVYLVTTGWAAVRRPAGFVGLFEIGAFLLAVIAALTGLAFGLAAAGAPSGVIDGEPAMPGFVLAALASLAAATDLKVILRGGVDGNARIARHLWRMCASFLIATISFFLGQQRVMPAFLHGSPWLLIPAFAPLVVMLFWLVRIRMTDRGSGPVLMARLAR